MENIEKMLNQILENQNEMNDMSTLFWTYFFRTLYFKSYEFICDYKIASLA